VTRAVATFAAGCFWGIEAAFRRIPGVVGTTVGYAGGDAPDPTYEDVCAGTTGHAECVRVEFDPARVRYEDLVDAFWRMHDPTQGNRQGVDVGTQYRSMILYHDPHQESVARRTRDDLERWRRYRRPITTEIVSVGRFWAAESHHQRFFEKQSPVWLFLHRLFGG
jgi:peptide-methionine (S)-S-oxide reductase